MKTTEVKIKQLLNLSMSEINNCKFTKICGSELDNLDFYKVAKTSTLCE